MENKGCLKFNVIFWSKLCPLIFFNEDLTLLPGVHILFFKQKFKRNMPIKLPNTET